ncbi:hypothetical protein ACG3SL_09835 [Sphingomonas sp. CJ20]
MDSDRWEQGSYPYMPSLLPGAASSRSGQWVPPEKMLVGSGRIALARLVRFGRETRGWSRLLIPSYYCQDVVDYLAGDTLPIARYPCGPWGSEDIPEPAPGDVLLRVAYFGWNALPPVTFSGDVIEDHTHNPEGGGEADSDFAFASLRKILPLPDGGMLWSPRGHALPHSPEPDAGHDAAALMRLAAMAMKRAYLQGEAIDKAIVRALELSSEAALLKGGEAPISDWSRVLLDHLPLAALASARRRNHRVFRAAMAGCEGARVLGPAEPLAPAVALVRVAPGLSRDALRARLSQERIYTAVLWPIPEDSSADPEARAFSDSTFAVHVDGRYGPADMARVAARIRALSDSAG